MAKFADFPDELIKLFVSPCKSSPEDLYALSLVCKLLYRITNPLLYKTISVSWVLPTQRTPTIHLLLRTLLEQPRLAVHVEHIQFVPYPCQSGERRCSPSLPVFLSDDFLQRGRQLVRTALLPSPEKWLEGIDMAYPYVFVGLVLSQLQNLKSLELGAIYHSELLMEMFTFALSLNRTPSAGVPSFRHLERVFYGYDQSSERSTKMLPANQLRPLLSLPSMQGLSVWGMDKKSIPTNGPSIPTITTLEIHHIQIQDDSLAQLLRLTPNLKRFKTELWIDAQPDVLLPSRSPSGLELWLPSGYPSFFNCHGLRDALNYTPLIKQISISVKFFARVAMEVERGGGEGNGPALGNPWVYWLPEGLSRVRGCPTTHCCSVGMDMFGSVATTC